jgi:hypothetical protein
MSEKTVGRKRKKKEPKGEQLGGNKNREWLEEGKRTKAETRAK